MSGCSAGCPREAISQDNVSIGTISDDESIARGAYDPSHGNAKTYNIKGQLIPVKDVIAGTGSVYRLAPRGVAVADLIKILEDGRPDQNLFAVTAVPAAKIRGIEWPEGGRAFCVVDECDSDRLGNKHPAHAHIALCRNLATADLDRTDPNIVQVYRDLMNLFRSSQSHVWNRLPIAKQAA